MYHRVEPILPGTRYPGNHVLPEAFEEQLAELKRRNYQSITLEQWIAYREKRGRLPHRPIIITFDDGYQSTYHTAWPILRRYGFSATVFLVAGLVGKTNAWDVDERQEPLLNESQIRAMQSGAITFGSHTQSHRALTRIPVDEAARELADSRRNLESLLDRPVTALCYPFAKQNSTIRRLARGAGYSAAVIGRGGTNRVWTDQYALRRIKVDTSTTITELGRKLRGRFF
ncbi:MAG: polysaccharide deacetylase family protein [Gemmatimonadota bacterium]|nr:polysaccharide deacetylase family protein [Gemmatimonadota bacterium]